MQISISHEEFLKAPPAVRLWLCGTLPTEPQKADKPKPKADSPKADSPKADQPEVDETKLLEQAYKLIQLAGEDVLAGMLKQLGLKRVKGASAEKRQVLQAMITEQLATIEG